ncbi:unnamed protein product [Sphagnum compactum]
MQSRQLDRNTAGATAVVAVLKSVPTTSGEVERHLYVGNVGDSRAVLVCEKGEEGKEVEPEEAPTQGYFGRRLTFDHRSDSRHRGNVS